MKGILKALAYVELILGTAGSFLIARFLGMSPMRTGYERDWLLTIGIFAGSILGSVVLFVILFSIAEMLHNQETIYEKINKSDADIKKHANSTEPPAGGWKCSRCGKSNANYVGTCSCGNAK